MDDTLAVPYTFDLILKIQMYTYLHVQIRSLIYVRHSDVNNLNKWF